MSKTAENLETTQVYIDFVKNNLEPLAQHLKVGVEWLWDILVMQARVEAISLLVVSIILSIFAAIALRVFFKNLNKARYVPYTSVRTVYKHKTNGTTIESRLDDWENRDEYTAETISNSNKEFYTALVSGILSILLLIISLSASLSNLSTIVTGLVNPEFRAIEKVVEFAKPKVEQASEAAK